MVKLIPKVDWEKYYVIGESVTKGKEVTRNNKYYGVSRMLEFFDETPFNRKRDAKEYLERNYKKATDRKLFPYEQTTRVRLYSNGMLLPERTYLVDKERNGAVVVKGDYIAMFYHQYFDDVKGE